MAIADWQSIPLVEVASELGLARVRSRPDRMTPCPACGHEGDSVRIYHGSGRERWHCHSCSTGGDAVDLVAMVLTGRAYDGQREVADWYGSRSGEVTTATWAPAPVTNYPDRAEVLELLGRCRPAAADHHVLAWLRHRGLSSLQAGTLGAMTRHGPPWARWAGEAWPEQGYRAVVPMVDAGGSIRTVRCRRVFAGTPGPKALPPCPVGERRYRASGVMMAGTAAQAAVARGLDGREVVLVEGEPAWLTWCVGRPDAVVLGIVSGSWCPEWAAVVGRASSVLVVTDHDDAGDHYYDRVVADVAASRWAGEKDVCK